MPRKLFQKGHKINQGRSPWNKGLPKEQQPFFGKKKSPSEETRKNMSESRINGIKDGRIKTWNKGLKGWTNYGGYKKGHGVSDEVRIKMSISKKIAYKEGRMISPVKNPEVVKRIVATRRKNGGYIPTIETRNKISNTLKRKGIRPKIIKQKAALGTHHSDETKKILRDYSIKQWSNPVMLSRISGKNAHNWMGGISFEPYSEEFNNQLKKKIRDRDKNKCIICGNNRLIHVHHIDYNKNNNSPNNLVTLCINCHGKTNNPKKRPYYNWQLGIYNKLFNEVKQ